MNGLTIGRALALARTAGLDRLDAQLLLAHVVARPRPWVLAHDDAMLDGAQASAFGALIDRRAAGEPLAYIVGTKEFHGLSLYVDARVLVPRPETETLVDWAVELLRGPLAALLVPAVIDLGTGSGAIAIAVKHAAPHAQMTAVDASAEALEVAVQNARSLSLPIACLHGDWWGAVPGERYDLALANPPYVAEGDAHLDALQHEPRLALTSGRDGLDAIRRIVDGAVRHIAPGGWLLVEHGHDQAAAVQDLLTAAGWADVASRADLAGIARCTGGRRVALDIS
jgi:release factor glutamine methyltransferase